MLSSILSIAGGATAGALLRWLLGQFLNPLFPTLPLGTLAANLVGGYLMGIMMVFSLEHSFLSPEIKLAIITGFLGALTTFSTFSGEAVYLLEKQELSWFTILVSAHVVGSILMTLGGVYTARLIFYLRTL